MKKDWDESGFCVAFITFMALSFVALIVAAKFLFVLLLVAAFLGFVSMPIWLPLILIFT